MVRILLIRTQTHYREIDRHTGREADISENHFIGLRFYHNNMIPITTRTLELILLFLV